MLNYTQYHYHHWLMELLVKGCSCWFSWAPWPWKELVQRLSTLVPWRRHLLQKIIVKELANLPSFYKTWRFITTLITAHHWSQSWVRQIQFTVTFVEKLNVALHQQGMPIKTYIYCLIFILCTSESLYQKWYTINLSIT
jgi:hypothetical protein